MRLVWLVPVLFLVALADASGEERELWRWVDDQGVVHFSDRPVPGAEKVTLRGAQTFSAPAARPQAAPPEGAAGEDPAQAPIYRRLSIVQPGREETLRNIEGRLDVRIEVDPPIRGRHELRAFLDGQPVQSVPPAATAFTVANVFRGEHTLRVAIVDETGREIATSDAVRFFVHQTSLLNPSNPATSPPRPTPQPGRPGGG